MKINDLLIEQTYCNIMKNQCQRKTIFTKNNANQEKCKQNQSLRNPSKTLFYNNFKLAIHLGKLQATNQQYFSHARAYLRIQKQKYYFQNIPQFRNNIANFQCMIQYDRISLACNSTSEQYDDKFITVAIELEVHDKFIHIGQVSINLGKTLNYYTKNKQKPHYCIYPLQKCYDKTAKIGVMLVFSKLSQNKTDRTNKIYYQNRHLTKQLEDQANKYSKNNLINASLANKTMSEVCLKQFSSRQKQKYEIETTQNNLKYIETERPIRGAMDNFYNQYNENFTKSKKINDNNSISQKAIKKIIQHNFQIDIKNQTDSLNKQVWQSATQKREYIQVDTQYIQQLQADIIALNEELDQFKTENQRYWVRLQQQEKIKQQQRMLISNLKIKIKQDETHIDQLQNIIQRNQKKIYEENVNQIKLKNQYLSEKLQQITIQSSTLRQEYQHMQINLQNLQKHKNQNYIHLKNQLQKYRQNYRQSQEARNKSLFQMQQKYKNCLQITVKEHISQEKQSQRQYQKQISALHQKIDQLKMQNQKLNGQIESLKLLQEEQKNINTIILKDKQNIKSLQIEIKNYTNQLQMAQILYHQAQKQNKRLRQQTDRLQKQNRQFQQKIILANNQINKVTQTLKSQIRNNHDMIIGKQQMEHHLQQIQTSNELFIYEELNLKQKIYNLQNQLKYFKNQFALINDETQIYQNQIQQATQCKEMIEGQMQHLRQHATRVQQQVLSLSQQNVQLAQKVQRYRYKAKHIKSYNNRNQMINSVSNSQHNENYYHNQVFQTCSQEFYNKIQVQNFLLKKQNQVKLQIQHDWKHKVQELQQFFKKMKIKYHQTIQKLKHTNELVSNKLTEATSQVQKVKSAFKLSETLNAQSLAKIKIIKIQKEKIQKTHKEQSTEFQKIAIINKRLKESNKKLQINLQQIKNQNFELSKQLQKQNVKNQQNIKKIKQSDITKQYLQNKLKKIQQEIKYSKQEIQQCNNFYVKVLQKAINYFGTISFDFTNKTNLNYFYSQFSCNIFKPKIQVSKIISTFNSLIVEFQNKYAQQCSQKNFLQKQKIKLERTIQLLKNRELNYNGLYSNIQSLIKTGHHSIDDSIISQIEGTNMHQYKFKPHPIVKQNTKFLITEMQNQNQRVLFQYKQKIKKQKNQIQAKKAMMQQYKLTIKELQKKIDGFQYEKIKFVQNIEKLQEKSKQIQSKYNKSEVKGFQLCKQICHLQTKIQSLSFQNEKLQKYKHQSLSNNRSDQFYLNKNGQTRISEANKFKIDKDSVITELKQRLEKYTQQLQTLKHNYETINKQNQNLIIKQKYLEITQKKCKSNQIKYQNQIIKLKNDSERQKNVFQNKLKGVLKDLSDKATQSERQCSQLRNKILQTQKSRLQMQQKSKFERQIIKNLQKQLSKYQIVINKKKVQKQIILSQEANVLMHTNDLKQKLQQYKQKIRQLQEQLKQAKQKVIIYNKKTQNIEIELKKKQIQFNYKQDQHQQETSSLKRNYAELQKGLQQFIDRRYQIQFQYNFLVGKYQKLQKQHEQLRFCSNSRELQLENTIQQLQQHMISNSFNNNSLTSKPPSPISKLVNSGQYNFPQSVSIHRNFFNQSKSVYKNQVQQKKYQSNKIITAQPTFISNLSSDFNTKDKKQQEANKYKKQEEDNIFGSKFTFNSD